MSYENNCISFKGEARDSMFVRVGTVIDLPLTWRTDVNLVMNAHLHALTNWYFCIVETLYYPDWTSDAKFLLQIHLVLATVRSKILPQHGLVHMELFSWDCDNYQIRDLYRKTNWIFYDAYGFLCI